MTGFNAELLYPSQKAKVKPQPRTQQAESGETSQTGQTGLMEYKKKKGNQQAMKLPMISPKIRVARRSFFRAILFFSFSASCSGVNFGPKVDTGPPPVDDEALLFGPPGKIWNY